MAQGGDGQRSDEDHLQQEVDGGADEDGADHGAGQVALGVAALAAQLHRLLEAE